MTVPARDVTELLRQLVQIPSVNPDGDPGTSHTGEENIARFVGEFLSGAGAEVTYEEVLPGRPNVIGRFPTNSGGKPEILLAPHTDTVSIAGMTVDPFGGEVVGGKLYGRGACDTKGTMAAMLWALKEMGAERVASLGCRVTFVGLIGEESGQYGSKHFAEHHPAYDFAIVGEPTGCDVVVRTKGALWPVLTTTGKAVHGSKPELGENAITKMAPVVTAIDTRFREHLKKGEWCDSLLGHSTVNIGMVQGGSRTNIVADRCQLNLDIRMTPSLYTAGGIGVLCAFIEEEGLDVGVEAEPPSPPLDTAADNPFISVLESIGAKKVGAPWFCDASWLGAGGIPGVAAGPGSIDQAHTADEWISVDELDRGVVFYRRFLEAV